MLVANTCECGERLCDGVQTRHTYHIPEKSCVHLVCRSSVSFYHKVSINKTERSFRPSSIVKPSCQKTDCTEGCEQSPLAISVDCVDCLQLQLVGGLSNCKASRWTQLPFIRQASGLLGWCWLGLISSSHFVSVQYGLGFTFLDRFLAEGNDFILHLLMICYMWYFFRNLVNPKQQYSTFHFYFSQVSCHVQRLVGNDQGVVVARIIITQDIFLFTTQKKCESRPPSPKYAYFLVLMFQILRWNVIWVRFPVGEATKQ